MAETTWKYLHQTFPSSETEFCVGLDDGRLEGIAQSAFNCDSRLSNNSRPANHPRPSKWVSTNPLHFRLR